MSERDKRGTHGISSMIELVHTQTRTYDFSIIQSCQTTSYLNILCYEVYVGPYMSPDYNLPIFKSLHVIHFIQSFTIHVLLCSVMNYWQRNAVEVSTIAEANWAWRNVTSEGQNMDKFPFISTGADSFACLLSRLPSCPSLCSAWAWFQYVHHKGWPEEAHIDESLTALERASPSEELANVGRSMSPRPWRPPECWLHSVSQILLPFIKFQLVLSSFSSVDPVVAIFM